MKESDIKLLDDREKRLIVQHSGEAAAYCFDFRFSHRVMGLGWVQAAETKDKAATTSATKKTPTKNEPLDITSANCGRNSVPSVLALR